MTGEPLLANLPWPVKKAAVLRASRIGDFLCGIPALRALRAALPEAEISLITLPMFAGLTQRLPYVDRFIAFPGYPGIASQLFNAANTVQFFNNMLAESFDLAVQLHGTGLYSNPFTLLLGAQRTAGFIRPGDRPDLLDASLPFPARGHEIDRLLALTNFLGAPSQGRETEFPLTGADHDAAEQLLAGYPTPWIGLHPAAHSRTRRWPAGRFAELGRALLQRYGGTLVFVAGPGEEQTAAEIAAQVGPGCLNLAGKTGLNELGAVIARLALLVTNDSGPAHLAYALSTPAVVIWGGEDLERYGPPAAGPFRVVIHPVDCRPCADENCPIDFLCLEKIQAGEVLKACAQVIRNQA